VMFNTAMN